MMPSAEDRERARAWASAWNHAEQAARYATTDAEAQRARDELAAVDRQRRAEGWPPERIREVMAQTMLELHPPIEDQSRCQVQGTCGAPGVNCPLHQVGWTCRMEIDGYGVPQPGAVLRLASVAEAEKHLDRLRELWEIACPKERPALVEASTRAKARIEELRILGAKGNPCGHAASTHRVPPNVLDQETADAHLDRLRGLWEACGTEHPHSDGARRNIEASACAIKIIRPLLPARRAS